MEKFGSVDEALDFAVAREEEAYLFYMDLAEKTQKAGVSDIFKQFAKEEQGHKAKLIAVKEGRLLLKAKAKVLDLKIGEYLVTVEPDGDLDYQSALILAMKKEKAAFKLYNDLAAADDDEGLKSTFLTLAQEEAKHKLRFEVEYDQEILKEN